MARRSLKPQLNQIRTWVRQGRTDPWIAHQLDVPVKDISQFKRDHDLAPTEAPDGEGEFRGVDEDVDLQAQDDALVAAALDAEPEQEEPEPEPADDDAGPKRRRRRGRRGGRAAQRTGGGGPRGALEATFDHGDEGYGVWLDPAVQDDPVYAEHWAGHRPLVVIVEPDQIVFRRAGEDEDGGEDDEAGGPSTTNGAAAKPAPESSLDPDDFDA